MHTTQDIFKKEDISEEEQVPPISFVKLFKYSTWKERLMIFIGVICAIITGLTTPANSFIFGDLAQAMISHGGGTSDVNEFLDAVNTFAMYNSIIGAVMLVFSYISVTLFNYAAHNQIYRIRGMFFRSALNQDISWYDLNQSGEFASRMNEDLIKLDDGIGEKVVMFVHFISAFAGSIILAFVKGWELALVCLSSIPVIFISFGLAIFMISKLSKKEVDAYAKAGNIAEEVLSSIRTVIAFDGQDKEVERYKENLNDAKKLNVQKSFYAGLGFGLLWFFIYASYALAFWYGVGLILEQKNWSPQDIIYTPGTMITVFFSVMMGSMNLAMGSPYIEAFGIAKGAGAKVYQLIDQIPKINPLAGGGKRPNNAFEKIQFKNISFQYPSRPDVKVLDNLNLTINRGETVALVGSSGCGKSTCIQLMQRFYDPIKGEVCLDEHDIKNLNVNWLRQKIGAVGQEPVLFNTTIYENIRYGREDATKDEIEEAAKAANAHIFIKKLPNGYDTLVGERGAQLSGGQKQRIAIARALIRNPDILLLDEATSALDTASEAKVQVALEKASEGRTTIIVAHRLSTIRNANKIFVLNNGRIVETGTHQELMELKGHYYGLVTTQIGTEEIAQTPTIGNSMLFNHFDEDETDIKVESPKYLDEDSSATQSDVPLLKIMKLNATEWPHILIASIGSAIAGFAMPIFAILFGDILGVLSIKTDDDYVRSETNIYCLYFVIAGFTVGLSTFFMIYAFGIAGEILTERIRSMTFSAMVKQEVAWFDDKTNGTGTLCARLSTDAAAVQGATGQRIGSIFQSLATLLLGVGLSMYYAWKLGLVALAFTPFILIGTYLQSKVMHQENMVTRKAMEGCTKIEDTHNNQLQLIPLKQQQNELHYHHQQQQKIQSIGYKFDGKRKKLAHRHSVEIKPKAAFGNNHLDDADGGITQEQRQLACGDNNHDNLPNRKTSLSKWKRGSKKQQQQLQQQQQQQQQQQYQRNNKSFNTTSKTTDNISDNNLQRLSENARIKTNDEENEKITKQLTSVQFNFDTEKPVNGTITADHIVANDSKNQLKLLPQCNGTTPDCIIGPWHASSITNKEQQEGNKYEKNADTAVKNEYVDVCINDEKHVKNVAQLRNENAGNYDEIPLVKIENTAEGQVVADEQQTQCQQWSKTNLSSCITTFPQESVSSTLIPVNGFTHDTRKSSESIPFIDSDDDKSHHHLHNHSYAANSIVSVITNQPTTSLSSPSSLGQFKDDNHNSRFITLHPKNVVSSRTYNENLKDAQASKYLQEFIDGKSTNTIKHLREESFLHSQTHLSDTEHNFQSWKAGRGKLCQVCHGSLIVKPNSVVKCFNCDLICHNWCATSLPTIRYHDTSFIIFQKWLKAQDELAFPAVYQYTSTNPKWITNPSSSSINISQHHHQQQQQQEQEKEVVEDHSLTDSECTYRNGRPFDNNNKENNKFEKNGIRRRRTKSLEKCIRLNDDNDDVNDKNIDSNLFIQEPIDDNGKIQIIEKIQQATDDQNNNNKNNNNALGHETIKLQIIESDNNRNNSNETDKNSSKNLQIQNDQKEEQTNEHEKSAKELNDSIDEVQRTSSYDVIVDVHCPSISNTSSFSSNQSEALIIKEHDSPSLISKDNISKVPEICKSNERCFPINEECLSEGNIPVTAIKTHHHQQQQQSLRASSNMISGRTYRSETISDIPMRKPHQLLSSSSSLREPILKAYSEPFQRKNYNRGACNSPISTTSSSSLSLHIDDADEESIVDYATVDLRKPGNIYPASEQELFSKSSEDRKLEPISKSQSFPVQSKHHYQSQNNQITDSLRLHYVTQRILASVLPRRDPNDPTTAAIVINGPHRVEHEVKDKYEEEVVSMLEQKHGKNYKVLDLESCISVVTLERLCELCKLIDQWLGSGKERVIVLQDREDRQRLGVAIAAYLEYMGICSSGFTLRRNGISSEDQRIQNTITRNWLDLDIFSMRKFLEDFIGPLRIPSHKRYLQLFAGLLSRKIKMNSSPLQLEYISVESPPSWLQYDRFSATASQTEWNSFIKIYEGLQCIYTSDIHIIPITTRQFLYQINNLRLRGDILIRCYQIVTNDSNLDLGKRELLFSVQFHTCAINHKEITFKKEDLDFACEDPRFPNDHRITLHLGNFVSNNSNNYVFQSPLIRTEPPNALAKIDSIESFDISSLYHTQGPIDGSLYATILKSPAKPHPNHLPLIRSKSVQENFTQQNLISPPPEFSSKQYDTVDRRTENNTLSAIRCHSVEQSKKEVTSTNDCLRGQSHPRIEYNYIDSRPGTSQSLYQDKYSTISSTGNYPPVPQRTHIHHHHQQQQQQQQQQHHNRSNQPQITVVETYSTVETNNQNGRQSVRSPLTLSMDSGISSSGVLNRPQQGSSVSPSSFPSQASPQEDRHRELDDILTDMLMTVQDIPDLNKTYRQHSLQKIVRSQSVIPSTTTSRRYGGLSSASSSSATSHQFGLDTVKRSQSYTTSSQIKDRSGADYYETSSTTTTLTPPPSESGRDTPVTGTSSNISTLQHRQTLPQRDQQDHTIQQHQTIVTRISETTGNIQQHQQQQQQQHQQQNLIMDTYQQQRKKQHQSSVYPQANQTANNTEINCVSEDDEIPYHARENSQPFTYGNVPPIIPNGHIPSDGNQDPKMIKTQSGLSSPSLVRKTLGGTSNTLRKTPPRNDFEEMLRERREKVMSEKYLISDKPSNTDTWTNNGTLRQTNGYHYYNEPLKRSNTLDGFHRSTSTDGISSQTWLQLQQQKLRAKKDQELRDNRRYFEQQIHTEIRNRPLRSRANVQRYDGYASDTAAFADEVDYRRPLHVQTPYRSPDRNYHTITTTTKTVTQREPSFSSLRRTYDQSKPNTYGSPPVSPISVLNTSSNGHITQQSQNSPNGLLSMADSPTSRNGHVRLESDLINNAQADNNNTVACSNVNHNNHNNSNSNNNSHIIISNNNTSNNNVKSSTDHAHHVHDFNKNSNFFDDNHCLLPLSLSPPPPPPPPPSIQSQTLQSPLTSSLSMRQQIDKNANPIEVNCNYNNNNSPPFHQHYQNEISNELVTISTTSATTITTEETKTTDSSITCGQLVLDRLLASLAIQTDLMDQQLAATNATTIAKENNENQINNNSNNLTSLLHNNQIENINHLNEHSNYKTKKFDEHINRLSSNSTGQSSLLSSSSSSTSSPLNNNKMQEVSDVIADLKEFTRCETLRQLNMNGYSDNVSNVSSSYNNSSSISNGAIPKRIASESENSSSISPSLSERSNVMILWPDQVREESFSSYRSETEPELSYTGSPRPETPAFPVTPRTPYGFNTNGSISPSLPPKSPTSQRRLYNSTWSLRSQKSATSTYDMRKDPYSGTPKGHLHEVINQNETISCYTSRRNSNSSNTNSEPQEVAPHHVKFVQDSSKYWYKPNLSREEAVNLLRHAVPGTFIVRDSTTFRNAFGLVVRVAHPPPGVIAKGNPDELVRHFLVEPTSRGVRLKGCANEPVFSSLSALVYQHSITPLALPCRLIIPDRDIQTSNYQSPAQKQLITQGAACNVLYLFVCDTESLTGEEAVRRAVYQLFTTKPLPKPTEVHFKVSQQGITLTDNTRQKFFRKHYSANIVSFCGLDPDRHMWSVKASEGELPVEKKTIFAFVARRSASSSDNQCHVFCDLQPNQPATAIVSFVNKVLPTEKIINQNI